MLRPSLVRAIVGSVAITETVPCVARKARSLIVRFALDQRKGEVAAEDQAAGTGETVGEALRHRADAGDGHDAERDAGNKHAETAQSAAQLAPGKTQRKKWAWLRGRRQHQTAAFGMTRTSTKCAGANASSGNPISCAATHI